MNRARTFTQWLNEAETNAPWFVPTSEFIAGMLAHSGYDIYVNETGVISIESDAAMDDLDWPDSGDRFWISNTIYLTPVFGEVSPELERLYRAQAARNPESFLDELTGFYATTEKRFWSKDVDLDHAEKEDHGLIEFPVEDNEDFEVEFGDFVQEYMGSFGFYEDELNDILRQSFPWVYGEDEDDEEYDDDDDEDEDLEED